eukprot:TRINITY_DN33350_c0_g1_i1.p1 TRINITY_DN33350_c0_g1~~TRINITY_DN33350_c0_g1_i1.p1  ORF type:complete len:294 (-),score=59.64 TRINITY_DN33350_c0_g1_i1:140-1021(-)
MNAHELVYILTAASLYGAQAVRTEPGSTLKAPEDSICEDLGKAYLASLPIPLPPPGLSVVPAVALLVCCPQQTLEGLKAAASKGVELLQSHGAPKDKDEAEEEKRVAITEFYASLVSEHSMRNSQTIRDSVRSFLNELFGSGFDSSKYVLRSQVQQTVEVQYPWVLYPRLLASYNDTRLDSHERELFVHWLSKLKVKYAWLPELPADVAASTKELEDEWVEISLLDESDMSTGRGSDYMLKMHSRICGFIGHQAKRPVLAMSRFLFEPSKLQLQDLTTRVKVLDEMTNLLEQS